MAAMTSSLCQGTRTTTATRSTSGCAAIWLMSWKARSAPNFSAEAFAVSACAVHTALRSKFGNACKAGTWALAPQPLPPGVTVAPTIPTLILSATILFPHFCAAVDPSGTEDSIAVQAVRKVLSDQWRDRAPDRPCEIRLPASQLYGTSLGPFDRSGLWK